MSVDVLQMSYASSISSSMSSSFPMREQLCGRPPGQPGLLYALVSAKQRRTPSILRRPLVRAV